METRDLNEIIEIIKERMREGGEFKGGLQDEVILEQIQGLAFQLAREHGLTLTERKKVIQGAFNALRRLDILQPLIDDDTITEIMVNGPDHIFIERQGASYKLDIRFSSQEKLEDVIQSIVSKVNRVVNEASPIVDARLPDGSRVNVVLPPIALNGPILTIRKFPSQPILMKHLIQFGSITQEAADFLGKLVKARYNIFVCGGTGSGKTTFLNVLSNEIPGDERIITIEDSAELQILQIANIVKLETRNANVEGKGQIPMAELIRSSLRMRPDRIIVGEVRGAEALDMLQAMNTGHDGSLSTGHGNSPRDMLSRLETMVLCGAQLPLEAIRQQIAAGIDLLVHLARLPDKSRGVMEITELVGYKDGNYQLNPLFQYQWEEGGSTSKGKLIRTPNPLVNTQKLKMAGLA